MHYRRTELKMNAINVCKGICSVSTYSHYENNDIIPDMFVLCALSERMGLDLSRIEFACSEKELKISTLRTKIKQMINIGDYINASNLVGIYEKIAITHGTALHKQYIQLQYGKIAEKNGERKKAIIYFENAMDITQISNLNLMNKYLMTCQEFELIYRYYKLINDLKVINNAYLYLYQMDDNSNLKKEFFAPISYYIAEKYYINRPQLAIQYMYTAISYQKRILQIKYMDRGLALKNRVENNYKKLISEDNEILNIAVKVKKISRRHSVGDITRIIEFSRAEFIKYLRMQQGKTQEEFAEGVCDARSVRRYENGSKKPNDDIFFALVKRSSNTVEILYDSDMKFLNECAKQCLLDGENKKAEEILKRLWDYLGNDFVVTAGEIKYKICVNYSNALYNSQKYNESMWISIMGFRRLCAEQTQDSICEMIFNIGRCMCKRSIAKAKKTDFFKGLSCVDAAISICKYFKIDEMLLNDMKKMRKELTLQKALL